MKQLQELIQQSDMVLIGTGDEFTEKKAEKEQILQAYQKLNRLIEGKPWFLVTVNTDDYVYDAGMNRFFVVAPCGSERSGNVVTNLEYDESGYLPQWEFYRNWLASTIGKRLLLLELGVGMAYPSVIRMPFERTTQYNQKAYLVRIHSKLAQVPEEIQDRSLCISEQPVSHLLNL